MPDELSRAYAASPYGAGLQRAFPWGELHRARLPQLEAWQQRFHPEIKRRTPKKRKRK